MSESFSCFVLFLVLTAVERERQEKEERAGERERIQRITGRRQPVPECGSVPERRSPALVSR